jgi:hypothetical protein
MKPRHTLSALLLLTTSLSGQRPQKHEYPTIHACGLTAHALFDGKLLKDLPPKTRHEITAAVYPQIRAMSKDPSMGIDGDHLALNTTLFVSELTPRDGSHPVFAVMWENKIVCGAHENCPVWLTEKRAAGMRLIKPSQAPESERGQSNWSSLTAWAAGMQTQPDGNSMVLLISSGYAPEGGGKRDATCERLHDGTLQDTPCSATCDIDTEVNMPDQVDQ